MLANTFVVEGCERNCKLELAVKVGFEVARLRDVSRTQLISACRSLEIQLGPDKSKAKLLTLVGDAMLKKGIVKIKRQCSRRQTSYVEMTSINQRHFS